MVFALYANLFMTDDLLNLYQWDTDNLFMQCGWRDMAGRALYVND